MGSRPPYAITISPKPEHKSPRSNLFECHPQKQTTGGSGADAAEVKAGPLLTWVDL